MNVPRQKSVAAVHDISGFGRCSLTVALPILSAAGIQTSVVPTAVLSAHTGGISGGTFRDLSEDIPALTGQWHALGLRFDGIYTGYLGGLRQIEYVRRFIEVFYTGENVVIVDPAMADNGKLYTGFDAAYAGEMTKLCRDADIITPNITEAEIMLGESCGNTPQSPDYIAHLLNGLSGIPRVAAVLTGVRGAPGEIGAACIDKSGGTCFAFYKMCGGHFHGAGDVFASVLTAALVKGQSLQGALRCAVGFTADAIARTSAIGADERYGIAFEPGLVALTEL